MYNDGEPSTAFQPRALSRDGGNVTPPSQAVPPPSLLIFFLFSKEAAMRLAARFFLLCGYGCLFWEPHNGRWPCLGYFLILIGAVLGALEIAKAEFTARLEQRPNAPSPTPPLTTSVIGARYRGALGERRDGSPAGLEGGATC